MSVGVQKKRQVTCEVSQCRVPRAAGASRATRRTLESVPGPRCDVPGVAQVGVPRVGRIDRVVEGLGEKKRPGASERALIRS